MRCFTGQYLYTRKICPLGVYGMKMKKTTILSERSVFHPLHPQENRSKQCGKSDRHDTETEIWKFVSRHVTRLIGVMVLLSHPNVEKCPIPMQHQEIMSFNFILRVMTIAIHSKHFLNENMKV